MPSFVINTLARGTFSYLLSDPAEIRRVVPQAETLLPEPRRIFLERSGAEPLLGFPVLRSSKLKALEKAMIAYLEAECEAQFAYHLRQGFDSRAYAGKWDHYRAMLDQAIENVTVARHGGNYSGIFWLDHSMDVARYLQQIPKRLRRQDLTLGREHGDEVKYKVFFKWIDRAVNTSYDTAHRLASEMDEDEEALFPGLLALMRDNVLIFTEDYISPDLSELASYFNGCLKIDGRDLRRRLASLEQWHRKTVASDEVLRSAVTHLLHGDLEADLRQLFGRPGYVRFLASHAAYSEHRLLAPAQIAVWESLVQKIKEFEILHALRKMIVPLEEQGGALVRCDRAGGEGTDPRVSTATRPIDFTAAWVVNPVVERFGLVYDITDFSSTISMLGRAERMAIEDAFRMTSSFQRKINRLASSLDLRLEKYLGDGAFYSGRHARRMLIVAVHLQRFYPQFLDRGFPFRSGLRIAMNYGEYRLMPLEGAPANGDARYEFFGHGLVELSRLSTGKKTQELEEFKTYLISQGYPENAVNKFFAPMTQKSSELVSKIEESRRFFAYINQNSALINEGIVATEPFVSHLGTFSEMYFAKAEGRGYIVVPIEEDPVGRVLVGIRKLGIGRFKGLEPMPVYEVVDGDAWGAGDLKGIPSQKLMGALERLFMSRVSAAQRRARPSNPV